MQYTTCHSWTYAHNNVMWSKIEWCLSDLDQELASVSPQKADHATSCEIVTQWGEEGGRARVWFIITHHYNEWSWTLDTGQTIDNGDSA